MMDPVLGSPAKPVLRILTKPLVCAVASSAIISAWHMPSLYDWTLRDKLVHVGEHLMFLCAALLYWWPIASPSRQLPPPGYGVRMLYLLGTEIAMIPVCAYIVFSADILYPTYEYAPRLIRGLSPADDQLMAGVIMKVSGMAVSLIAIGYFFLKWSRQQQSAR
jgi:putative membrane protein